MPRLFPPSVRSTTLRAHTTTLPRFTARAQQCAIDSEKVEPCNNQLRFEERFDERGSTRLTNLMLKWGEQDEPSMAATLDFFEAAAVSDTAPQQHQSSNLRETLRTALGRPADTADTTLSASKCKGFLSIPDESGWQRRWAVLTCVRTTYLLAPTTTETSLSTLLHFDSRVRPASLNTDILLESCRAMKAPRLQRPPPTVVHQPDLRSLPVPLRRQRDEVRPTSMALHLAWCFTRTRLRRNESTQ